MSTASSSAVPDSEVCDDLKDPLSDDALSDISSVFNGSGSSGCSGENAKKIMARVRLIEQRRLALGPPTPTAQFPVPAAGACKYCKREFKDTRQPLPNKACPFLERSRVGALDCMSCRNAQNWAFKSRTKKDLLVKLDAAVASSQLAYPLS